MKTKYNTLRYIILINILFFLINIISINSQWFQCYQTGNIYNGYFGSINFIDHNTGLVVCGDSAIIRTTNGGLSWYNINGTVNHGLFNLIFAGQNNCYAIGNVGFNNGQFLKSTNSGVNWSFQQLPYYVFSMDFVNENTGYLSDDMGQLHKTTNGGISWISINPSSSLYLNFIDFIDLNNGFIAAADIQRVLVTSNGGLNWTAKYSPSFTKIQFLNINTGYGIDIFPNHSILYKTTNNADSWNIIFQMDSTDVIDVNFINLNTGWITCNKLFNNNVFYRKLYKSTNSGSTWFEQNTGNIDPDSSLCLGVISMIDSNYGFISTVYCEVVGGQPTSRGRIYKTTNGGGEPIGIEPIYSNIPIKYKLFQNYPNPFNSSTNISFEIPEMNFTELIIYDVTGRMITALVNESLNAGKYEVKWNADKFTSGVYFYTLRTGRYTETKKMLLIK